jgi:hypothetical protein
LVDRLSEDQKRILKFQLNRFLGTLSMQEFRTAINSLKNFGDKVNDFLERYGGPLSAVISGVLARIGLDKLALPSRLGEEEPGRDESLRYHFEQLLEIARAIEFKATYILVDRVDEIALTAADAALTYEFIRPLIVDLPTLEAPGVAFKFFLWDQIEDHYRGSGIRPDRVPVHTLRWTIAELATMLSQRLLSYSSHHISSLNQLLCPESSLDLHRLVIHLASGSPRDMIRLSKRIIAEQTRTSDASGCVEEHALWTGIRTFANERSQELFGRHISELSRVGEPTFTISHLASEVFRVGEQAARRKLQIWSNTGVVTRIGEVPNPPNRPLYLFGITDLRVAIAITPWAEVPLILDNYARQCPYCRSICISDRNQIRCLDCNGQFELQDSSSLLDICHQ